MPGNDLYDLGARPLPERVSIELTNRCSKGCTFCYNSSSRAGGTRWTPQQLVGLAEQCATYGTRAVSLGGGEPLEYAGLYDVLEGTRGRVFRSITTNGLLLDGRAQRALLDVAVDKVHVSLHFPAIVAEVRRVATQVAELRSSGVVAGVNLLVRRSELWAARRAWVALRAQGLSASSIVLLPMRPSDTPTPRQLARVAQTSKFQSVSCLGGCAGSSRFCAISWDWQVGLCSYTSERRRLVEPTARALQSALNGLGLVYCGTERTGRIHGETT